MKERRPKVEIVGYEVGKIAGDPTGAIKFKSKAIDIQHKAWDEEFANEKYEIACDVLIMVGNCFRIECDSCPLKMAHEEAVAAIASGTRQKPIKRHYKKFKYAVPGYWVTIKTDPITGVTTTVMRPYKEHREEE